MSVKQWERAMRLGNDGAPMSEICYPEYWADWDAHWAGKAAGGSFKSRELEAEYRRVSRPWREKEHAWFDGHNAGIEFRRKEWLTATEAERECWR